MIKNFEYKIPLNFAESYKILMESGNEILQWELVDSDKQKGIIEWKQKFWSGLGTSKIKIYLREPRPNNTLATIYVNRPVQILDPFKMCERVYKKLEKKLNEKIEFKEE